MKKCLYSLLVIGLLLTSLSCTGTQNQQTKRDSLVVASQDTATVVIDDWGTSEVDQIDDILSLQSGIKNGGYQIRPRGGRSSGAPMSMDSAQMGFAVGGAKDANNFRENIKKGFQPQVSDITYEGIFYDYYFDTAPAEEAVQLFEPSYSTAVKMNPITHEEEIYLSVGLNSNISEEDFARKNLNLTIVLDISGSMQSPFNSYYYDRNPKAIRNEEYINSSKMEIACKSIVALTKHLRPDDRLAVVLFDNYGKVAKKFRLVGKTDMDAIREHILDLRPQGGTNMYAGMELASNLYKEMKDVDYNKYENRIIFLTDAMPNQSITDEHTMWGIAAANAEKKVYTTYIGVGVDFNSKMIEYITKTKGSNYYSVHNYDEFNKRLNEEFEFMVTPLVFDLTLELESERYEILEVLGSPEAEMATGTIMKVNTLFPSASEDGATKGGIILIKLKDKDGKGNIALNCNYKDRNGKSFSNSKEITEFKTEIDNPNGIGKGIVLAQYVSLMHNWLQYKEDSDNDDEKTDDWYRKNKNKKYFKVHTNSEWERRSTKLTVSNNYKERFNQFKEYIKAENEVMKDNTFQKEIEILEILEDLD